MTLDPTLQEAKQARKAAEEKFLATPTSAMVDADGIRRRNFFQSLTGGAGKGAMFAGLAVAVLGIVAAAAMVANPSSLIVGTIATKLGLVSLPSILTAAAGAVGLGAVIGGVTSAGKAVAEGDKYVQAEVQRVENKKAWVRQRQQHEDIADFNYRQQDYELERQTQLMSMRPQPQTGRGAAEIK